MFDFYATIPHQHIRRDMPVNIKYLLSASSTYGQLKRLGRPVSTKQIRALDCGGFVAARKWQRYPYTIEQYLSWVALFPNLEWFAAFDYCCEPEIADNPFAVARRQDDTTAALEKFTALLSDWRWCIPAAALVPTVQGWNPKDYERHARAIKPYVDVLKSQAGFRVGIGTLCIRADDAMIADVVDAVADVLPDVKFHLWGVKLKALPKLDYARVASADSAAWDTGGLSAGKKASVQRKALGMTQAEFRLGVLLPDYMKRVQSVQEAA